ncbi:MAG: hypothetical protein GF417_14030 [Candidatus Latescibacteria bacterium]|nr:hypothetical protein [bacterium]MBD3425549.1 hypothetical protein [Candidatus Latescibacterota bacterium]
MFTPHRMHQMNVIVFESDLEEVAKAITRLGVLHLIKLDEEKPWTRKLEGIDSAEMQARIEMLREKISSLMKKLEIREVPRTRDDQEVDRVTDRDLDGVEEELVTIETRVDSLLAKRERLKGRIGQLENIFAETSPLLKRGIPAPDTSYRFLMVRYGKIRSDNIDLIQDKLADLAAVALRLERRDDEDFMLVVGLKSDRLKLKRILREAAFEDVEISDESRESETEKELTSGLEKKITGLRREIDEINGELQEIKDDKSALIARYYQLLRVGELYVKVKGYIKKTSRTYLFSGWVPSDRKNYVKKEILKASSGRAIIEIVAPEEVAGVKEGKVKVPVQFKHPRILQPFGILVSSYGTPGYNVIDPTFLVAISFLFMFGMMFGDVGHGAILAVIGILMDIRSRKRENRTIMLIGRLALYCGVSSMIFGVLFGSIFGIEDLFEGLWRKPMDNVLYFFKVAIYFGIIMISGGIVLNAVNAIRMRAYKSLLFDHAGIISGVMYWCGVAVVSTFLASEPVPVKLIAVGIILPLVLIFLREPISAVIEKRRVNFQQGVFTYLMETVIEIMEIVTGYLGNTVSFIRVAAFSLAHVGLFIAVFSLVDMVKDSSGGIIYSALILILGNAVVIVLEGLVVTIQAIRLEYYEFFSKFFVGGGRSYQPISLKKDR